MNYHNITKDDMLNGVGLRVVLWVAGCNHYCKGCQNPVTWDPNGGIEFDGEACEELFNELEKDYINGITFSGGDPMYKTNRMMISVLCYKIKREYQNKTIWLYTGYTLEELINMNSATVNRILHNIDVLVDGKFIQELADLKYHWAGSTNQRIIDMPKTLEKINQGISNSDEYIVLYKDGYGEYTHDNCYGNPKNCC